MEQEPQNKNLRVFDAIRNNKERVLLSFLVSVALTDALEQPAAEGRPVDHVAEAPQAHVEHAVSAQHKKPEPPVAQSSGASKYGPGVWIANEGSGYYLGRAFKNDMMQKHLYSDSGAYVYGFIQRSWNKVLQCGWIESKHVSSDAKLVDDSVCEPYMERLKKRWTFGKKFNCGPGKCVDGKEVDVSINKSCDHKLYFNYVPGRKSGRHVSYPNTEEGFYDYAGKEYGEVRYRYTTRDSEAVVVRSYKYGWGYMEADCIDGYPKGGPKKHGQTVAGKNPNAQRSAAEDSYSHTLER